jgi:metal-dependent amidase/aminoacylase/carboxypeptidase family protein
VIAWHCDRDQCDTWVRQGTDLPTGFVAVYEMNNEEPIGICCSIDCLMHWAAAHSEPGTSVEL